jgi:hypothetical protein
MARFREVPRNIVESDNERTLPEDDVVLPPITDLSDFSSDASFAPSGASDLEEENESPKVSLILSSSHWFPLLLNELDIR